MDITNEVQQIIGQPEGAKLEYKQILPPSRNIAQLISAFANTEGGCIILGVSENLELKGLSDDFHANETARKALGLLSSQPQVYCQYVIHKGKKFYAIKVEKSTEQISVEGKAYKRSGGSITLLNPTEVEFKQDGYPRIKEISQYIKQCKKKATSANTRLLEHYQSILKIIDDLGRMLYPADNYAEPTEEREGKILSRILFSSFVDNFETYLSDLLYEIFLAKPETLKSNSEVTIREVLDCSDLDEFVKFLAKKKISKLQKGSVKGFISDTPQIKKLNVINSAREEEIERILQIRHLYSHRNGIVDEKFLKSFVGEFSEKSEHRMSIDEFCNKLLYLAEVSQELDNAATSKFSLDQMNNG